MRASPAVLSQLLPQQRLRRVERLRLTLPDNRSVHAARHAVEDALATADFADAGRWVILRRLAVRSSTLHLSGPALRGALESAWRQQAARAVPFDAPAAARADAVYAPTRTQALLHWVCASAVGRHPTAWFWPQMLGCPAPAQALDAVFMAVLGDLARAAPRQLQDALTGLPPNALRRVLAALQTAEMSPSPDGKQMAEVPRSTQPAQEVSRAGHHVAATFAGVADADSAPSNAAAGLPPLQRWLAAALSMPMADVAASARAAMEPPTTPADAEPPATPAAAVPVNVIDRKPPAALPAAPTPEPAVPVQRRATPQMGSADAALPWLADAQPSTHAGLLMLLNALRAIGLPQWLDTQEPPHAVAVTQALFTDLAARLRLPADDPQRALWTALAVPTGQVRADAPRWRLALRRALRLQAGIGLASLCRRSGRIFITDTHVDVIFPLAGADLRIRKAGLDLDPGWVPWFGRIVAFQYLEDRDAR